VVILAAGLDDLAGGGIPELLLVEGAKHRGMGRSVDGRLLGAVGGQGPIGACPHALLEGPVPAARRASPCALKFAIFWLKFACHWPPASAGSGWSYRGSRAGPTPGLICGGVACAKSSSSCPLGARLTEVPRELTGALGVPWARLPTPDRHRRHRRLEAVNRREHHRLHLPPVAFVFHSDPRRIRKTPAPLQPVASGAGRQLFILRRNRILGLLGQAASGSPWLRPGADSAPQYSAEGGRCINVHGGWAFGPMMLVPLLDQDHDTPGSATTAVVPSGPSAVYDSPAAG